MNGVSEMETSAEKQARYVARRAAWAASRMEVVETPGQEFWAVFRKQSDFDQVESDQQAGGSDRTG